MLLLRSRAWLMLERTCESRKKCLTLEDDWTSLSIADPPADVATQDLRKWAATVCPRSGACASRPETVTECGSSTHFDAIFFA